MTAAPQDEVLPPRPYPGLRAFHQEEWAIFFGREEHADEVITRLGGHGLVLVHGSSGCGKSSLVRAAVMPMLETNHQIDGKVWRTATMRPSEGLLTRLAEVLEEALPRSGPSPDGADSAGAAPLPWDDLVLKGGGLVDHVEAAVRASGGGSFCLLVDQFEEIFRWAREKSDAEVRLFVEFLKRIGEKGEEGGFFVILTMRSDYFGACANYDGFAEFLNPRQYLLPRMDEFGLLRAIHEPAELYGGTVDAAVSSLLLPVLKVHLDGLPVLQHALMRASDHARRRHDPADPLHDPACDPDAPWRVTRQDLSDVGGAGEALAQHAELVLQRATGGDDELLEAAEWIFRALTDLDADRRAIRRPCRLGELIEVSGVGRVRTLALLKEFRSSDCTFISPYLPEEIDDEDELDISHEASDEIDDEDELDISHEALIRQWPRLCNTGIDPKTSRPLGWVYREFHDGLVWRSLAVQAEQFAHDPKHLLSVATTEQRLPWFHTIEKRPGWTERHAVTEQRHDVAAVKEQWADVKAMMEGSAKNLEREHTIVNRLRRARNVTAISALVTIVSILVAAVYFRIAYLQGQEANEREQGISAERAQLLQRNESARAWLMQFTRGLIEGQCEVRPSPSERERCLNEMSESVRESVTAIMQMEERPNAAPAPPRVQYQRGKSEPAG